jgi:predicted nucleic acid-binding protein
MIVVADSGPLHYLILLRADLILIDDFSGRAEARRRSLRVTGTLGILRTAAEKGLIDVPAVLTRLRDTSFYVDESLIDSIFHDWLRGGADENAQ